MMHVLRTRRRAMSRQLRVQFPGAIYHVTSRGNRRQAIVVDDLDRDCFFERVGKSVERYHWEMFAAVLMTNHFHLFFRTPQANLSRGMQFLLSGYASWWNARHRHSGHVFQGRFRGHLVEDESYFWTVSRYVHLNPTPVLVDRPEQWKWSSYMGYVDPSRRFPWIDYDVVLNSWQGEFGGLSPANAYCQYVESGLAEPTTSPFENAIDGWILGSANFADHVRELISPTHRRPSARRGRHKVIIPYARIAETVCNVLEVDPIVLSTRRSRHPARALVAYLSRCATDVTLAQLAEQLGLARADSVPTQIRRVIQSAPTSELRRQLHLALGLEGSLANST
jgi:putative transposase